MGPIDLLLHLLGFAAPAMFVALAVTLTNRVFWRTSAPGRVWWVDVAINFVAGLVVLAAGLAYFGRDGKMATYAGLVLVAATTQWLAGRTWRR